MALGSYNGVRASSKIPGYVLNGILDIIVLIKIHWPTEALKCRYYSSSFVLEQARRNIGPTPSIDRCQYNLASRFVDGHIELSSAP